MNQNKTTKPTFAKASAGRYLKYAIGEIILVVIGILIALQINNWNENRKDLQNSEDYRQRILNDLEDDVSSLNSRIGYWFKVSESGRSALKTIEMKSEGESWETILNLYYASQINPYDANSITFEELKSAGELRLIPDTQLRSQLANYYRLSEKRVNIIWGTSPKYREKIRGVIPYEIQDYILANCYDINQELDKGFKPCDPPISDDSAKAMLQNILKTPQILEDLNFWIGDMTIAIELAEQEIDMAKALISDLTKNSKDD